MRMILIASLAVLAACSAEAPSPATPPAETPPAAQAAANPAAPVIEAERAFAAEGARSGWIDAYPIWAAKDGMVLQRGLTSAHDFAANIHPDVRGDTSLAWGPEFAGISKAGDFGFTAGPFNGDGTAFGYYLTVWRKQADGAWRWLFEGGIDVAEPTTVPGADAAVVSLVPEGGESSAAAAVEAVDSIEQQIAAIARTDVVDALRPRLAPALRMYRETFAPATDAIKGAALLAQGPRSVTFSTLRSEVSRLHTQLILPI